MVEKNLQEHLDTITFELEVGYTDENGVTHKEVEIREMTGFDEEQISKTEIRGNIGKLMTTLLSNLTVRIGDLTKKAVGTKKWEKIFQQLPMGDRDRILLEIRKFTHGDEIELDMTCPHCKTKLIHVVEIDNDVEIRPLQVENANEVPFELPKGIRNKDGELCKTGFLRLPNGEDQEFLDAIARKNMGQANTSLLQRTIIKIDGIEDITLDLIRKMSVRDREYLLKLLAENSFGPRFEIQFPCPTCGEEVNAGVHPVNFL